MCARNICAAYLVALLLNGWVSTATAAELGTIYWESEQLRQAKVRSGNPAPELKQTLELLRDNAEVALQRGPYSVVDKEEIPPSGDKHDYMSFSRYWWPNPDTEDGLPYIRKDGEVNVELRKQGDRDRVGMLMEDVETLALAAFMFDEEKYGAHARTLIRVWFLDPATRMNPNVNFGQAVPGRSVGRGVGIIDTRGFLKILDSVALLQSIDAIEESEVEQLREWFSDFLQWLLTSELGIDEAARGNNHGSWYRAQTARIALFVNKNDTAAEIVEEVRKQRIGDQFEEDGSQPEELVRTQSLHYSFFNLDALSVVARVGEHLGIDLWKSNEGGSLRPGIDFLIPYVSGKKEWAHPQIRRYSMSRGTCSLLRMASVRYDDQQYLVPMDRVRIRHAEFNYSPLLFRQKGDSGGAEEGSRIHVSTEKEISVPTFTLPDISGITNDSVANLVPPERKGTALVGPSEGEPILSEAFRKDRLKDLQKRQGTNSTQVIKLSGGAIALQDVVSQIDDQSIIESADGVVTVRLPILVKSDATLIIDGQSISEVRLSTDRGAFLANAGSLFVVDAKVTSWDEKRSAPTELKNKYDFRPFISSYIRSKTYLADSKFYHLGYHAPTAYGLSLSSQPEREDPSKIEQWPTGIIVDNKFIGLYYGFYSYEARAVKIVDNTYSDCILYGIDPHDRSTELVIAKNTATGTKERHGIIGSRGISKSFIFDNTSHDNNGSGIMLDRQCTDNVICNNRVFSNGQGIAIYESPSNIIARNLVVQNAKSGVRIRNSIGIDVFGNQIVANGDYGLEVSSKRLDDHDKRAKRGDDYTQLAKASIFDNVVAGNNRGIMKGSNVSYLLLSNLDMAADIPSLQEATGLSEIVGHESNEELFGSELKKHDAELRKSLNDEKTSVELIDFQTE